MRIIGIDYGTKRVGLAVSDENRQFALPLSVIPNGSHVSALTLAAEVIKIAANNDAKDIIIGDSRQNDMTPNAIMPAVLELKKELESAGLAVKMELEYMSSMQAERLQGKNDKSDASAAAVILQSYLDSSRNAQPMI